MAKNKNRPIINNIKTRRANKKKKNKGEFGKVMSRFATYFIPYKFQVIVMMSCAVLAVLFSILGPKILGNATNIITAGIVGGGIDFRKFYITLISLAVVYALSALFSYIQQKITAKVAQTTLYDLRQDVDAKIQRLPLNYYDTHTNGDILSRTTTDIEQISTSIQQILTQLVTSALTIVGIVIMMLTISWEMTVIALLVIPIAGLLCSKVIKKSQPYYAGQQDKLGEVNSYVEEHYSGHTIVKLYGAEEISEEEFEVMNDGLREDATKAQFASSAMMPVTNLVGNIGYVLICALGGIMTLNGNMTIGGIQAFLQYMNQFTQPMVQTANILNLLQSTLAAAERVFELLDEDEQSAEREDLDYLESATGDIVFDHVKFGYSPHKMLITDMNVHIKPGQKVGICGPTGAGKTTMINLLMRFYDINGGKIFIDGTDSLDISRENMREQFGMVLQDTWLYSDTIRNNIRYGKPEATDEEVENACKAANAHFFIETLPDGYETVIDESASNLSAGQKQLLTIARAFCSEPQILILDEATSSVDTRTEKLITQAMQRLTEGKTNFQIAHRLSTIRDSDIILVLKDGDLVEQGDHDELMTIENGVYAGLYNSQFA